MGDKRRISLVKLLTSAETGTVYANTHIILYHYMDGRFMRYHKYNTYTLMSGFLCTIIPPQISLSDLTRLGPHLL